ncbi:Corticotropin-releasing factor receptor 2 [Anabarilius grahami]|uniref:Corticotropin-releasing factor receptor 2 n=1 Tax=Anabarilius grahami TaxID=495550 RepID=A0A3N0YD39_ANAGA|nr:Corticotropin-releasing factor receptor 2 [Anabarilius grahami]
MLPPLLTPKLPDVNSLNPVYVLAQKKKCNKRHRGRSFSLLKSGGTVWIEDQTITGKVIRQQDPRSLFLKTTHGNIQRNGLALVRLYNPEKGNEQPIACPDLFEVDHIPDSQMPTVHHSAQTLQPAIPTRHGAYTRKYPMHYKIALIINYFGHCISVGALVIAFILFLCLRSIRCLRNIIHWNLITTFILRNVMWFLLQLIDQNIYETNEPWCRLITTIYNYFVVTNFFWMFVEGCYLHTAIVMTYSTDKLRKWVFLFIGWCIPCPIIIVWAIGKLYNENEQKAVKATLVLLPLLGITYMLFFVNPGEDDISQIVFIYFNSFLQSFQGFFVSVFYCFLNGEVRSAARKRWHRWQDNHALRVRVARAMSIPTSPTRISFHSIKQTTAV